MATTEQSPAPTGCEQEATKSRGGGAPAGNRNRTTHGVRGWLVLGTLPKGASWIRRVAAEFRRQVEAGVLTVSGELTPYAAALCQSATRHEARALLASRWLRMQSEAGPMPLSDKLALLKTIGDATDARDRCLKAAGLDRLPAAQNPWAALDATTAANASGGQTDSPAPDAADKQPERLEGTR